MVFFTKYSEVPLLVETNSGDYEVSVDGYSDKEFIKFFAYSDVQASRDLSYTFEDGVDDGSTVVIPRGADITDIERMSSKLELKKRAAEPATSPADKPAASQGEAVLGNGVPPVSDTSTQMSTPQKNAASQQSSANTAAPQR